MSEIQNRLKEQATLYVMDAMTTDEKKAFESKMDSDSNIQSYVAELQHSLSLTNKSLSFEPSEELLKGQRNLLRARVRQMDSVESHTPILEKIRYIFSPALSPRQPVWAVATYVIVAFVVGRFLSVNPVQTIQPNNSFSSAAIMGLIQEGALSDVEFEKSTDDDIRLVVETKQNVDVSGGTQDETIQQILYYLLLNDTNPGKRLKAVKLMEEVPVQDNKKLVLISSVLTETNVGVRLKALALLSEFETDKTIRDASLKILLEDENEAVRMGALSILANSPSADIVPALRVVSLMDENEFIRERASLVMDEISYLSEDQAIEARP